ncbi:MAG: hypothetical protein Q8R18_03285 [bacterium]|nr:hypothetical protein [bacterium]
MNTKYGILSVIGAGLVTPTYAQEGTTKALENKAGEYSVVMVPEGTPLYQVASEFVRGNDNLEDGILKTALCDDWKVRRDVSNANNDIARLTAKVADEVGMKDLQKAMLADDLYAKIKDGSNCESNPKYETVLGADGLYGDGFAKLKGYSGKVAVVIPAKYFTEIAVAETPVETLVEAPEVKIVVAEEGIKTPVETPVVEALVEAQVAETPVEEAIIKQKTPAPMLTRAPEVESFNLSESPSSYGRVAGGYQYIHEFAEAPLNGHGLWLEGYTRVPLKNQDEAGIDVNHAWFTNLIYTGNAENKVLVMDLDMSPVYSKAIGEKMTLTLGANIDARTATASYAGVDAKVGQWALGPELALEGSLGKISYDVSASLGWGNVSTQVDIPGYTATKDALTKAKVDAVVGLRIVPSLWLGGVARVENDSQDASTQDGGLVPQNATRYTLGGRASVEAGKIIEVDFGLEKVLLNTQAGDTTLADTGSVVARVGVAYNW